jgi:hypothetical protein
LGLGSGIFISGLVLGLLEVVISGVTLAFCLGVLVIFWSKCLVLVVLFNFKSIKFDSWHQNTTGKSRDPGTYWDFLDRTADSSYPDHKSDPASLTWAR